MKTLFQPENAHKFSIDALLLAQFAPLEKAEKVVELGTGCGIILLEIVQRKPELQGLGIDIDPQLIACSKKNIKLYNLPNPPKFIEENIENCPNFQSSTLLSFRKTTDLVITNPPWLRFNQGALPQAEIKKKALFGNVNTFPIFFRAARYFLKQKGILSCISVPDQLPSVLEALKNEGFIPLELQFVHKNTQSQSLFFLLNAEFVGKTNRRFYKLKILSTYFLE